MAATYHRAARLEAKAVGAPGLRPGMSDANSLSWLLRGRTSEAPGSVDTALLQAAAMAPISGDEPGALDPRLKVFGLGDLSVRQGVRATGGAIFF